MEYTREITSCQTCKGTGLTAFDGSPQRQCTTCWGAGKHVTDAHIPALGYGMAEAQ